MHISISPGHCLSLAGRSPVSYDPDSTSSAIGGVDVVVVGGAGIVRTSRTGPQAQGDDYEKQGRLSHEGSHSIRIGS